MRCLPWPCSTSGCRCVLRRSASSGVSAWRMASARRAGGESPCNHPSPVAFVALWAAVGLVFGLVTGTRRLRAASNRKRFRGPLSGPGPCRGGHRGQ
jgi:hypothetical protein